MAARLVKMMSLLTRALNSVYKRVGCTSADQSLDMRILASLYRTMIFPVALLSSVVDALQVTYRNTIRQAEKERERERCDSQLDAAHEHW